MASAEETSDENTAVFDSLMVLKKGRSYFGRDAVKAVIGKPVAFELSNETILYIFDDASHFRLRQTTPKDGEINGVLTKGTTPQYLCFDFRGIAQNHCDKIIYKDKQLTLVTDNGSKFVGRVLVDQKPPTKKPTPPFPKATAAICNPLKAIVAEAPSGSFLGLVDENNHDVDVEPYRSANIKLGRCLVNTTPYAEKVDCSMNASGDIKKDEELYQILVMQTYLCFGKKIKKTEVNPHLLKSKISGYMTAYSHFDFAGGLRISIHIGEGETCYMAGVEGCQEQNGIFVRGYYTE